MSSLRHVYGRAAELIRSQWPILSLILLSLVVFGWFKGNQLRSFWDVTAPYDPPRSLYLTTHLWYPYLNYGTPNFVLNGLPVQLLYAAMYALTSGSSSLAEQLSWWLIFLAMEVGSFYLFKHYLRTSKAVLSSAFCGSLIYTFNPYTTFIAWGDGAPFIPLVLATVPILLLLLEYYFSSRSMVTGLFYIVSIAALSPLALVFFPLVIPVVVIICVVTFSHFRQARRVLALVGLGVPLALVTNAYWLAQDLLLGNLSLLPINGPQGLNSTTFGVIFWSQFTPLSLSFRLLGENALYVGWWTFAGLYTDGSALIPLSLTVVPVFCIWTVFRRGTKTSKERLLYLIIALGGVALSSGANSGTLLSSWYLWWTSHFSFAETLDYPVVSWMPLAVLGYAMLFAFGIQDVIAFKRKSEPTGSNGKVLNSIRRQLDRRRMRQGRSMLVVTTAIVFFLIINFPLVNGDVSTNVYGGRFVLPSYVSDLANYLNEHGPSYRTLLLPPSLNGLYGFNWSDGFLAYDPIDTLTHVNLIANYLPNEPTQSVLFRVPGVGVGPILFSATPQSERNYYLLLIENSVKYIVVREDARYYPPYTVNFSYVSVLSFLRSNPFIVTVGSFGPEILFKVVSPRALISTSSTSVGDIGLSNNLLPEYVARDVSFSSPFPGAAGSVTISQSELVLTGHLNKSVPWALFSNQAPLLFSVPNGAQLLLVSNGSSSEVTPILYNGTGNHFLGATNQLHIDGVNVTIISVPAISNVTQIIFSSINGTVGISGIYIAINLTSQANLANMTNYFRLAPGTNLTDAVPTLLPISMRDVAQAAVAGTAANQLNSWPSAAVTGAWNITKQYISSNLTFSGSSPSRLRIVNGTIALTIQNSTPFDDLVNRAALNLTFSPGEQVVLYTTSRVGVLVYSDTTRSGPYWTGNAINQIYPDRVIETVPLPTNLTNLTYLDIQTQPSDSVNISSILLLNSSARASLLFRFQSQSYPTAMFRLSSFAPTHISGSVSFPSPGNYLISFPQQFTGGWQLTLTALSSGAIRDVGVRNLPSASGTTLFEVLLTTPGVYTFGIEFTPQTEGLTFIYLSLFGTFGLTIFGAVLALWKDKSFRK